MKTHDHTLPSLSLRLGGLGFLIHLVLFIYVLSANLLQKDSLFILRSKADISSYFLVFYIFGSICSGIGFLSLKHHGHFLAKLTGWLFILLPASMILVFILPLPPIGLFVIIVFPFALPLTWIFAGIWVLKSKYLLNSATRYFAGIGPLAALSLMFILMILLDNMPYLAIKDAVENELYLPLLNLLFISSAIATFLGFALAFLKDIPRNWHASPHA